MNDRDSLLEYVKKLELEATDARAHRVQLERELWSARSAHTSTADALVLMRGELDALKDSDRLLRRELVLAREALERRSARAIDRVGEIASCKCFPEHTIFTRPPICPRCSLPTWA